MPHDTDVAPATQAPAPKRRGGRRPGAGAPRGNLNALRSGDYSRQKELATLIFAAYPGLHLILRSQAIAAAHDENSRRQRTIRIAYQAILQDRELAQSIKDLVKDKLRRAILRLENAKA